MKKILLTIALLALPAFAQKSVNNGPPTNCLGQPQLILDAGNDVIYGCGFPSANGGGPQRADGLLFELGAPGSSSVINTAATLNGSSFNLGPGLMNAVGKTINIDAWGTYSITTGTPTLAIAIKIGSTTLCTATSSATTNAVTTFPWHFTGKVVTASAGATGADESHCKLEVVLGASATAAASVFVDNNTAASAGYDHTVLNALTLVGTAAGASNAALLRSYELDIQK